MDLSQPLSDEELDELADFLMSDATQDESMDISMLDGFLTALAIGPNTLMPGQWLPIVWGGPMNWESEQLAERMMGYVLRHGNSIIAHLREEPETFEPLIFEREHEGKVIPIIDEWCTGFVKGMAMDEAGWRPLMESEEGEEMLYPIFLYGTESGWERLMKDPGPDEQHQAHADSLGERVVTIMEWWMPVRKAKSTLRRTDPKVGRNDPCPCGSGRKFKQCCGGQKTVH